MPSPSSWLIHDLMPRRDIPRTIRRRKYNAFEEKSSELLVTQWERLEETREVRGRVGEAGRSSRRTISYSTARELPLERLRYAYYRISISDASLTLVRSCTTHHIPVQSQLSLENSSCAFSHSQISYSFLGELEKLRLDSQRWPRRIKHLGLYPGPLH